MAQEKSKFICEDKLYKWLPYVTVFCVVMMVLSLRYRFLDHFIATTWHGRLAYDFFSVPRSFINLLHGKSIYGTRFCEYGPYATWFPYHPAVSVLAGSWLSLFSPWVSYGIFAAVSLGLLVLSANLISRHIDDKLLKRLSYFFVLCSLPAYLLIWNGQMHVFAVLAFALVICELTGFEQAPLIGIRPVLMAGILVSLFSKPVILPALPALFAVKKYRRTILWSAGIYAVVSLIFIFVPFLNPQTVGLDKMVDALLNPSHIFRTEVHKTVAFNVYRQDFVNDNTIHWFNMRNLSGIIRSDVFEFFSVSSFLADIWSGVPVFIFKIPALFLILASLAAYFIKDEIKKARMVLFLLILSICAFFVAYDSVYEYHFTTILLTIPVMMWLYSRQEAGGIKNAMMWYCTSSALFYVPTSYFWIRNPALGHTAQMASLPTVFIPVYLSGNPYGYYLPIMRLMRVIPVVVMTASVIYIISMEFKGLWRHGKA